MEPQRDRTASSLGLGDAVSIIVGIVVGVTIFKAPPLIFRSVESAWGVFALWTLGGVLSLFGAFCYAELATTYRRVGGDYVYLTRAYGPLMGFLFGWAQLTVVLTGTIGAMAYVFADYAAALASGGDPGGAAQWTVWLAVAAVAGLSLVNLFGVGVGKLAQNVLTLSKVLGLAGVLLAGFFWGGGGEATVQVSRGSGSEIGLAMIFILYAYGGWNDSAFIAAEIRDGRRNIPRALILGTAGIAAIYLLMNLAYLRGLGLEGVRNSTAPAADVLRLMLGEWGSRGMSVLIMVSALGAVQGMIFTGSRVYAVLGADHRLFALLGRWHPRLGVPVWSIAAQAGVSIAMILTVGTEAGRTAWNTLLERVGLAKLDWDRWGGGFDALVSGTAPVFWILFLMTGLSLFVLRAREPERERPFTVPLYPLPPVVFCGVCVYMLYSSLVYARELALIGIGPLVCGVPLYWLSGQLGNKGGTGTQDGGPGTLADGT